MRGACYRRVPSGMKASILHGHGRSGIIVDERIIARRSGRSAAARCTTARCRTGGSSTSHGTPTEATGATAAAGIGQNGIHHTPYFVQGAAKQREARARAARIAASTTAAAVAIPCGSRTPRATAAIASETGRSEESRQSHGGQSRTNHRIFPLRFGMRISRGEAPNPNPSPPRVLSCKTANFRRTHRTVTSGTNRTFVRGGSLNANCLNCRVAKQGSREIDFSGESGLKFGNEREINQ